MGIEAWTAIAAISAAAGVLVAFVALIFAYKSFRSSWLTLEETRKSNNQAIHLAQSDHDRRKLEATFGAVARYNERVASCWDAIDKAAKASNLRLDEYLIRNPGGPDKRSVPTLLRETELVCLGARQNAYSIDAVREIAKPTFIQVWKLNEKYIQDVRLGRGKHANKPDQPRAYGNLEWAVKAFDNSPSQPIPGALSQDVGGADEPKKH
ncbi:MULTISPECIES: DUF4760 domain-containing protein [Dietzia]|uniref:DUF4760 domain-containing protein n=1 Tax=Dietzia maris TaxID=37915 RepID=A0ABT8H4S6_9ACTN|nr:MULTISPECIES: hypothetical protein [Dietzia]MCZ4656580.1 hypothetical protein [Dietzia kunjamensis]MDN4507476.1 hypothetical protein [Dietzia maris]